MKYVWNLFVAIDQLINALLGGDPDETISSRLGKRVRDKDCFLCKLICNLLNLIDPNHCQKTIEEDEGKDAVLKG